MNARVALAAVFGLLFLLVALMTLSDWTVGKKMEQAALEDAPLIITRGVTGTSFDVDGNIRYELAAVSATEYDRVHELRLVDPHVEIHRGDSRWVVDAKSGLVQRDEKSRIDAIVLSEQVHARLEGEREVSLESGELHYFPATEMLESPGAVVIHEQQNTTHAGQLRADLKAGNLELGQGVRSRYVAPAT